MAAFGLTLFFFLLRLMDEYKDHEKDKIVHPDRPIPRGLLTVSQVKRAILTIEWVMIGYSVLLAQMFSLQTGLCYLWIALHLWGMYKEFYVGSKLSDFPLLYAITHQAILVPVCWLSIFTADPGVHVDKSMWAYAALGLGAFFSYEVCRKLDPESHRLNKTYLQFYGPVKVALVVTGLIALSCWGAFELQLSSWIYAVQALTFVTAFIPVFAPTKYKITEGATVLMLVTHIWAIAIERWI